MSDEAAPLNDKASALQREIGQKKPFRSSSQEAVLGILRTADVVRRFLARVLEPYDVTPQQYNVLRILRGSGAEGLPTLTIGERMLEDSPGVTRLAPSHTSRSGDEAGTSSGGAAPTAAGVVSR